MRNTNQIKQIKPTQVCAEFDPSFSNEKTAGDLKREAVCTAQVGKGKGCEGEWKGSFGHGSERAMCGESKGKCVYKKCWSQRWSYAIPLEIIYQNPLVEWNPYDIVYYPDDATATRVTAGGKNGKKGKAYDGASHKLFFRTPASLFADRKGVSNADTSGGLTHVLDKKGNEREVVASGHWINMPEIPGIPGSIRQRYPVFPVHEHGSTEWKEIKALQEMVVNKNDADIKKILEEVRISAYGAELKLKGGGHDHTITITPKELRELQQGVKTQVEKTSSIAEAHSHKVLVKFDGSQVSVYDQWSIVWCSQTDKSCGAKTDSLAPGECTTSTNPSCCREQCPDLHDSVEVIIH